MNDLFQKIIEMSVMGSIVILVTILMRFILRRNSKKYIMVLWVIVALRLLVPVSFESALSVFNYIPHRLPSISAISEDVTEAPTTIRVEPKVEPVAVEEKVIETKAEAVVSPNLAGEETKVIVDKKVQQNVTNATQQNNVVKKEPAKPAVIKQSRISKLDYKVVLAIVWGIGVISVITYCVISYALLKKKLKHATEVEKNVYESEKVVSPFVLGLVIPKIYLPDVLEKDVREFILLHERTHIKHGDWIKKFVGMAVVAVHWFNPIVWIGYLLFEQDLEMFCDEDTVSMMDKNLKKAYTMSIVSYAKKSNNRVYLVAPLSFSKPNFGKKEVTNRVKNIINYKKGTKITAIITTLVIFGVSAACALNSTTDETKETKLDETTKSTIESTSDTANGNVAAADNEETTVQMQKAAKQKVLDVNDPIYRYASVEPVVLEEGERLQNYTEENMTILFKLIMNKATELYLADEYDNLIYGINDNMNLIVMDTAIDEYYGYVLNPETNQYEYYEDFPFDFGFYEKDAREYLMPFEDFVELPGPVYFTNFEPNKTVYNADVFDSQVADGEYLGTLYGFSSDLKYAYVGIESRGEFNLSADELLALDEGDSVTVMGNEYKVTSFTQATNSVENSAVAPGFLSIEVDNEDIWLIVLNDKNGDFVGIQYMNFDESDMTKYQFVRIPLADDAKINVIEDTRYQLDSITKGTFIDYLKSVETYWSSSDKATNYPDIGIVFERGAMMNYLDKPLVVKNGEITELTLEGRFGSREYDEILMKDLSS